MKFRPQMQLRFRDEAQYIASKEAASKVALSMNEWVLRAIESWQGGEGGEGIKRDRPTADGGRSRVADEVSAEVPAKRRGRGVATKLSDKLREFRERAEGQ